MSANKIEKAFLPVNKPFFKRDLRVGEDAIVNAPIFEEHSLTLYAYVSVTNWLPGDGWPVSEDTGAAPDEEDENSLPVPPTSGNPDSDPDWPDFEY